MKQDMNYKVSFPVKDKSSFIVEESQIIPLSIRKSSQNKTCNFIEMEAYIKAGTSKETSHPGVDQVNRLVSKYSFNYFTLERIIFKL